MSSGTLRALLGEAIDYAGLFPPAALTMPTVVANYDAYRRGADAWALGRLIVPAARLSELFETAAPLENGTKPWRVSAVVGGDAGKDADLIDAFNTAAGGAMLVDVAEVRAASVAAVGSAIHALAHVPSVFVEIPLSNEMPGLLDAIAAAPARAKVRTGGTTADAFPESGDVARFLVECAARSLPFKATAGLHHPLRGAYPLTYESCAASATMFGFLNVTLAAALARSGAHLSTIVEMLTETTAAAIRFDDDVVTWRETRLPLEAVADTRANSCVSFGSCSFREPLDDLRSIGLR